jgi:hypothetical protein
MMEDNLTNNHNILQHRKMQLRETVPETRQINMVGLNRFIGTQPSFLDVQ